MYEMSRMELSNEEHLLRVNRQADRLIYQPDENNTPRESQWPSIK